MIKNMLLVFVICGIILIPLTALAQANPCSATGVNQSQDQTSTLPRCINQIYKWALGVGALLALLMTVFGGYLYMTSSGNAEQASKGQELIWGAIIGLVLLFGAYLILNTINPDLVNFKVGNPTCVKNGAKISAPDAAACKAAGGTWDLFYVDPQPSSGGGGAGGS